MRQRFSDSRQFLAGFSLPATVDASAWYARLHAEPRLGAAERAQVLAELLVLCDEEARSAPLSGSAHLIKSKVMAEELGDLAAAQECARRAVELEPDRPQLRFDYVRLLIFRAEYNAAWDALRSYLLRRINERGGWSGQDVGLYDVALLMLGILCGYLMHGNDDDIDIWRELPVAFMRLDRAVAAAVADRLSVTFNFARTVVLIGAQHSVGVRTPRESASVVILGDSHILPLAWRMVNDKQLVPMLSMGLKAFHFSSVSGRARERAILAAHLAALPPSASLCIVSCGEIDCRPNHGIHLSLARGIYDSLEEAVRVLADGVVERLEATEWTGRFLVHPVRPFGCRRRCRRTQHPLTTRATTFLRSMRRSARGARAPPAWPLWTLATRSQARADFWRTIFSAPATRCI